MLDNHLFLNNPCHSPFPKDTRQVIFGMGCFWGVEKLFWQQHGIYTTAVGYAGGLSENPNYQAVCTGQTGHTEVVLVVYHPEIILFQELLQLFWENHDPTQGMRQGNDIGTQYRSAVFYHSAQQQEQAQTIIAEIEAQQIWPNPVVTEVVPLSNYSPAEDYHQDYYKLDTRVLTRFGYRKQSDVYYRYRDACGRDQRVRELWGSAAPFAK